MIAGLPYDAEVEYLESTRTQWIDTGVLGSEICNGGALEGEFLYTNLTNWSPLAAIGEDYNLNFCGLNNSHTQLYSRFNGSHRTLNASDFGITDFVGTRMKTVARGGYWTVTINGVAVRNTTQYTNICANNSDHLQLFWSKDGYFRTYGRIYFFDVFNNDGEKIRSFIPVRYTNYNGQPEGAMYDRVSRKLFRNAGKGSFTIGPDVATPVMGLHFMPKPKLTARDYVQNGLIAMWDGIENAGWGQHDPNAANWNDLIGGLSLSLDATTIYSDHIGFVGEAVAPRNARCKADTSNLPQLGQVESTFSVSGPSISFNNFIAFRQDEKRCNGGFRNNAAYLTWVASQIRINPKYGEIFSCSGVFNSTNGFWANGEFVSGSNAEWAAKYSANEILSVGSSSPWATDGNVWCIRLYNRALTAAEIAANYAIDKARFNLP